MPTPSNPELEHYRYLLQSRRRYYPIYGLLAFVTGIMGFFAIASIYTANFAALFTFNQPVKLLHLVLLIVFLMTCVGGIQLIRRAFQQPTTHEIEHYRQALRRRLFLQAQGKALPWWYRPVIRLLITLIGLIFIAGGISVLVFFGLGAIDAWFYILIGIFLLSIATYSIPREIRKLPSISAEQLAQNLLTGEISADDESHQQP